MDADDDLAELCGRMKKSNQHFCTILFCEIASRNAARSRPPTQH